MSLAIVCANCKSGYHTRCMIGYTRKGVLGGWVCVCDHSVCREKRDRSRTSEGVDE